MGQNNHGSNLTGENINKNLKLIVNGKSLDDTASTVDGECRINVSIKEKLIGPNETSNLEPNALSVKVPNAFTVKWLGGFIGFDSSENIYTVPFEWKPNISYPGDVSLNNSISIKPTPQKLASQNAIAQIAFNSKAILYRHTRNQKGNRFANIAIDVDVPEGTYDKGGIGHFESFQTKDTNNLLGLGQLAFNYDEPYCALTLASNENWIGFGNSKDNTKSLLGEPKTFTYSDNSDENELSYMYIYASDNNPDVVFGKISGTQTLGITERKSSKRLDDFTIYSDGEEFIKVESNNNGKGFTISSPEYSSTSVEPRTAQISYTLDFCYFGKSYPEFKSSKSGTFTLTQDGGNITPQDPSVSYNWSVEPTIGANGEKIAEISKIDGNSCTLKVYPNLGQHSKIYGTTYIDGFKDKPVDIDDARGSFTIGIDNLNIVPHIDSAHRIITLSSHLTANNVGEDGDNIENKKIDLPLNQSGNSWADYIPIKIFSISNNKDEYGYLPLSHEMMYYSESIYTFLDKNRGFEYETFFKAPSLDTDTIPGGVSGLAEVYYKSRTSKEFDTGEEYSKAGLQSENQYLELGSSYTYIDWRMKLNNGIFGTSFKPAVKDKQWKVYAEVVSTDNNACVSYLDTIKENGTSYILIKDFIQKGREAISDSPDGATISYTVTYNPNIDKSIYNDYSYQSSWTYTYIPDMFLTDNEEVDFTTVVYENKNSISKFNVSYGVNKSNSRSYDLHIVPNDTYSVISKPRYTYIEFSSDRDSDIGGNWNKIDWETARNFFILQDKTPVKYGLDIKVKKEDKDLISLSRASLDAKNNSALITIGDTGGVWGEQQLDLDNTYVLGEYLDKVNQNNSYTYITCYIHNESGETVYAPVFTANPAKSIEVELELKETDSTTSDATIILNDVDKNSKNVTVGFDIPAGSKPSTYNPELYHTMNDWQDYNTYKWALRRNTIYNYRSFNIGKPRNISEKEKYYVKTKTSDGDVKNGWFKAAKTENFTPLPEETHKFRLRSVGDRRLFDELKTLSVTLPEVSFNPLLHIDYYIRKDENDNKVKPYLQYKFNDFVANKLDMSPYAGKGEKSVGQLVLDSKQDINEILDGYNISRGEVSVLQLDNRISTYIPQFENYDGLVETAYIYGFDVNRDDIQQNVFTSNIEVTNPYGLTLELWNESTYITTVVEPDSPYVANSYTFKDVSGLKIGNISWDGENCNDFIRTFKPIDYSGTHDKQIVKRANIEITYNGKLIGYYRKDFEFNVQKVEIYNEKAIYYNS